jgi:uncharacterized protein YjbI with pentapeptide repeats
LDWDSSKRLLGAAGCLSIQKSSTPKERFTMETEQTLKLTGTKQRLEATDTDMSGSTFTDVRLSDSKFDDVNLTGTTINNANLSAIRISNANLAGASITESSMEGMTIDGIAVSDLLAAYRAVHVGSK